LIVSFFDLPCFHFSNVVLPGVLTISELGCKLACMFIKPFPKYNKTTKERYTIYRLCESYRFDGHIRHRTIIGFGKLDELPEEEQKKQLALQFKINKLFRYNSFGCLRQYRLLKLHFN